MNVVCFWKLGSNATVKTSGEDILFIYHKIRRKLWGFKLNWVMRTQVQNIRNISNHFCLVVSEAIKGSIFLLAGRGNLVFLGMEYFLRYTISRGTDCSFALLEAIRFYRSWKSHILCRNVPKRSFCTANRCLAQILHIGQFGLSPQLGILAV